MRLSNRADPVDGANGFAGTRPEQAWIAAGFTKDIGKSTWLARLGGVEIVILLPVTWLMVARPA